MNINLQNVNTNLQNTIDNNSDLSNIDSSKLLTTYQSPTQDLYNKEKPLITQDEQTILLRNHIPQQSELDRFLKNLCSKVLHTICLPIQAASLVSEYTKSPRFKLLYQNIKDGYFKGLQKRLKAESQEYVILNDILCKIHNTDTSNRTEPKLLIVIPERYQQMIFHEYHNAILTSHQGAMKTYLTMKRFSIFQE